jgi:hypothetical protein
VIYIAGMLPEARFVFLSTLLLHFVAAADKNTRRQEHWCCLTANTMTALHTEPNSSTELTIIFRHEEV